MATRVMVVWVLALVSLNWAVYGYFRHLFADAPIERLQAAQLARKLHKSEIEIAKLQLRFSVFSDGLMASGLRVTPQTPWNSPVRSLASVLSDPAYQSLEPVKNAVLLFDRGEESYEHGDYERAVDGLSSFVDQNVADPRLPKVQWMLADSLFQLGKIESSLRTIDSLTTHFPETQFAGHGLVLLGRILENRDRIDEAAEIYHLVLKEFKGSGDEKQAAANLKRLHL